MILTNAQNYLQLHSLVLNSVNRTCLFTDFLYTMVFKSLSLVPTNSMGWYPLKTVWKNPIHFKITLY